MRIINTTKEVMVTFAVGNGTITLLTITLSFILFHFCGYFLDFLEDKEKSLFDFQSTQRLGKSIQLRKFIKLIIRGFEIFLKRKILFFELIDNLCILFKDVT